MLDSLRPATHASPSTRHRGAQGLFWSALVSTTLLAACAKSEPSARLPDLKIDPSRVSVSGISSGAYMAAQAHVAFSSRIHGAALLAGGPYGCAEGNLDQALASCMKGVPAPDVSKLVTRAKNMASAKQIDPLEHLQDDPILIVRGSSDPIVNDAVAQAAVAWYQNIAPAATVQTDFSHPIGHVWPRAQAGQCQDDGSHRADCGLDMAAQMAAALAPATAALPVPASAPGQLLQFDQNLRPDLANEAKLDEVGYLYVPDACQRETCGLHIVFHGCEMNREKIGEAFVADADWHRQADARHLVLLYPQTVSSLMPLNPKGCWDWWGYTGQTYDQKQGAQLQWLDAVLAHFGLSDPG